MQNGNQKQFSFWNGKHGSAWARNADLLDVSFNELSKEILRSAKLKKGEKVLDIGCGSGGMTISAAKQVTSHGEVTGIDISEPMIKEGRVRAKKKKLKNITFCMGDASSYILPKSSFDVIISRLGCMFFVDPYVAFQNIFSSIKLKGRLTIGVWQEPRLNPWAMEPISVVRTYINMPPRPAPGEPGPFAFANADLVRNVLCSSGFCDIHVDPLNCQIPIGKSAKEALLFCMQIGPLASPLSEVTGVKREKAISALTEVLENHKGVDGVVRFAGAYWIIKARGSALA